MYACVMLKMLINDCNMKKNDRERYNRGWKMEFKMSHNYLDCLLTMFKFHVFYNRIHYKLFNETLSKRIILNMMTPARWGCQLNYFL